MSVYVLRRVAYSVLVLAVVLLCVFVMVDQIGDPARLMLPDNAPHRVYLELRHHLGLDDPFLVRLGRAAAGWLHGDFGTSLWQGVPALPLALSRLPATFILSAVSLGIAVVLSLVLGTLAALHPNSLVDRLLTALSLIGVSVADFWLGLMLILVFAVRLQWLPTSGSSHWFSIILPAATLAARPVGRLSQVVRQSVVDELRKPYITHLRARGIPERRIVVRHGLKNAAIPTIIVGGDEIATFLNGAVVIGTIFGWPGIGVLFIDAINQRDLPLVEACVFVISAMVIVLNLLVDLSYGRLDPRAAVTA